MAVVGANLTGQPLNWQFVERKAKLLETTRTGPGYRLYALADNSPAKPGLVFDDTGPGAIEVEVWETYATLGDKDITVFGGWRAWLGR